MDIKVKIDVDDEGWGVLTSTHFSEIREYFKTPNESRRFLPNHKKRFVSKHIYMISPEGKFQLGLLNQIYDYVKQINPDITSKQFKVTSRARYNYEPKFMLPDDYKIYQFKKFKYRDIQETAIRRVFDRGRGIIQVGTAGGKGLIIAAICKTLWSYNPSQTMVLVVPTHLVSKTLAEFKEDYEFTDDEISAWGGGNKPNFDAPFLIVGTRIATIREKEFVEKLSRRTICMIDECHSIKASSKITQRINALHTNNIIGFTGTLPEATLDMWCCKGTIGKVICVVHSKELRDKGYKLKSKVYSIQFKGSGFVSQFLGSSSADTDHIKAYTEEREFLLSNKARTNFIRDWITKNCKGNTLVPIDWDFHEDILREAFLDCERKVIFINANTPDEERQKIYKDMEHEKDTIVIVKVGVMREGISIKNLSYMVGIFIQKSFVRVLQLLGRIERLGGNDTPILFDFYDDTKYSWKHYEARKKIYENDDIPVIENEVNLDYYRYE